MAQQQINTPHNMPIVGIICNPHSRKGAAWLKKQLSACAEQSYNLQVTKTVEELPQALKTFAQTNINHIAIIGGDGTLDAVITALKTTPFFTTPPTLAAFAAGTTNMSHKDLGFKHTKNTALKTFIEAAKTDQLITKKKQALKIDIGLKTPLYGFFIGTGAIPRVIHKTRSNLHKKGFTSTLSEFLSLSSTLWQLFRAKNIESDPLLQPEKIFFAEHNIQKNNVFLAITSLDTLLLKIKPYHNGKIGFSVFGIHAPYQNFLKNICALLFCQKAFNLEEEGYINTNMQALTLSLSEEWTLDGEMFKAKSPLHISLATPLTFAIGIK